MHRRVRVNFRYIYPKKTENRKNRFSVWRHAVKKIMPKKPLFSTLPDFVIVAFHHLAPYFFFLAAYLSPYKKDIPHNTIAEMIA